VGSQFWDLDFTHGASHDPGPRIFLAHDFQDMDGEPGNFTMSESHGHPLVFTMEEKIQTCLLGNVFIVAKIITFKKVVDFFGK